MPPIAFLSSVELVQKRHRNNLNYLSFFFSIDIKNVTVGAEFKYKLNILTKPGCIGNPLHLATIKPAGLCSHIVTAWGLNISPALKKEILLFFKWESKITQKKKVVLLPKGKNR